LVTERGVRKEADDPAPRDYALTPLGRTLIEPVVALAGSSATAARVG
jgi:DNA-binding HxlR family transcriptional regulator